MPRASASIHDNAATLGTLAATVATCACCVQATTMTCGLDCSLHGAHALLVSRGQAMAKTPFAASQAPHSNAYLRRRHVVCRHANDVTVAVVGGCVECQRALAWPDGDSALARHKRPGQPWLHLADKSHGDVPRCRRPAQQCNVICYLQCSLLWQHAQPQSVHSMCAPS